MVAKQKNMTAVLVVIPDMRKEMAPPTVSSRRPSSGDCKGPRLHKVQLVCDVGSEYGAKEICLCACSGAQIYLQGIVLSIEDKLNYLEQPIPPAPVAPEGQQVAPKIIVAHAAWIKRSKEIVGLMLMTIEPEIQQNLENLHAHEYICVTR
ncbi:hypothetical protein Tco_0652946 [Tanacetum coccineum]|uniref:Uncharacterized protein n=1 Tax=Tanacetum coccineum TaxID=301880 RepID=A0ABQ4WZ77_9ASTR